MNSCPHTLGSRVMSSARSLNRGPPCCHCSQRFPSSLNQFWKCNSISQASSPLAGTMVTNCHHYLFVRREQGTLDDPQLSIYPKTQALLLLIRWFTDSATCHTGTQGTTWWRLGALSSRSITSPQVFLCYAQQVWGSVTYNVLIHSSPFTMGEKRWPVEGGIHPGYWRSHFRRGCMVISLCWLSKRNSSNVGVCSVV